LSPEPTGGNAAAQSSERALSELLHQLNGQAARPSLRLVLRDRGPLFGLLDYAQGTRAAPQEFSASTAHLRKKLKQFGSRSDVYTAGAGAGRLRMKPMPRRTARAPFGFDKTV